AREAMIEGVEVTVDREAVVVTAAEPLAVVSSAVVGGGLTSARAVVNLHVPKSLRLEETEARLAAFAARRGVPVPWVGLLTAAWTEKACVAEAETDCVRGLAVVSVGLSNRIAAGLDRAAAWSPSTINTIVVVDAVAEPAARANRHLSRSPRRPRARRAACRQWGDRGRHAVHRPHRAWALQGCRPCVFTGSRTGPARQSARAPPDRRGTLRAGALHPTEQRSAAAR